MCLCSCSSIAYLIIFLSSLINQVVFVVLNSLNCEVDNGILTILWLQTIISFFTLVYLCIPGLRTLTKLFFLHLLPSLLLLVLSLYAAYTLMQDSTVCSVYGNDLQPLINAALFCQGIIPILAIIIFSNDTTKSCKKKTYEKMSAYDTDEE